MSSNNYSTVGGNYGDKNVFSSYVNMFAPKLNVL